MSTIWIFIFIICIKLIIFISIKPSFLGIRQEIALVVSVYHRSLEGSKSLEGSNPRDGSKLNIQPKKINSQNFDIDSSKSNMIMMERCHNISKLFALNPQRWIFIHFILLYFVLFFIYSTIHIFPFTSFC